MMGLLIRVGIDQTFGGWNCPLDPHSLDFEYIPVPEHLPFNNGFERHFVEYAAPLQTYCEEAGIDWNVDLVSPPGLFSLGMHLDPDFENLTYGDSGPRTTLLKTLCKDDIIGFYAALRSYDPLDKRLVYALVGLFVVQEVVKASAVPIARWHENAHTRRIHSKDCDDVVVRAKPTVSGRLRKCIPIGEWRNRAYRVRRELLNEWGGLSVYDGFIQRSGWPPSLLDASRFHDWFHRQRSEIVQSNY